MIELRNEDDGTRHGLVEDGCSLTVLPDGESRIFKRNAIRKHLATGETEHIQWLVAELNGVRAYVNGSNIILTTQDLNP